LFGAYLGTTLVGVWWKLMSTLPEESYGRNAIIQWQHWTEVYCYMK